MLILVTGSRHATVADHGFLISRIVLDVVASTPANEHHEVYVGDAPGVDFIIWQLFIGQVGWKVHEFEAYWEECGPGCPAREHRRRRRSGEPYCPYAGPRRNRRMVAAYADAGGQLALAFPERGASIAHSGTWGCAKEATDAGLEVRVRALAVNRRG